MADDINDNLTFAFAIAIAIIGVVFYGKHRPMSRGYRAFMITLAVSAATQALIKILARLFGDAIPTWQTSLLVATLALTLAGMALAIFAARTGTGQRERPQPGQRPEHRSGQQ